VSAWVVHLGFTHVSDDDYTRVTIAQAFAHAPSLDPSGTSWLPFPFWLNGAVMAIAGRSLAVAQGVALVTGVVGAVLVHAALLRVGVRPIAAFCGVALAMCAPLSAWLGVATVPEALTASLIAAGALCMATPDTRPWGAAALFVAALSRYEAWPVAVVFAAACAVSATWRRAAQPRSRWTDAASCALALAGPAAWVLWNAHAHGDALHFLARVTAYRARMTSGTSAAGLALYPVAFVRSGPVALAIAAAGVPALFVDRDLGRRWIGPLAAMVALVLFLVEGDLRNGAPTHHPERALVAVFWVGTLFGVDGVASLATRLAQVRPGRRAWAVGLAAVAALAWIVTWPSRVADFPGRGVDEDRTLQVVLGTDLRERGAAHVTLTPCAYEHFAVIAAFGAPERVTIEPQATGGGKQDCPHIEER
jgi:hypothetical protein